MTDILKSVLYYLLMLAAFALLIFTIGCSTENPLCTDSFCLVPRDTVDDSTIIEIDESKVIALIGKTKATDTIIPPTPPVPTLPATNVSLSDIIADVAAGNNTYLNQTVTLTEYVVFKNERGTAMVIHTIPNVEDATAKGAVFWIESFDAPEILRRYALNTQHTFTVTIRLIKEPEDTVKWRSIWAVFADETN